MNYTIDHTFNEKNYQFKPTRAGCIYVYSVRQSSRRRKSTFDFVRENLARPP